MYKNLLIVLVAIGVPALADARVYTMDEYNVTDENADADRRAPWFKCVAEGNYPDPTTCDCYIACTRALNSYQMPCAMGTDKQRLYYVPTSGPDPAKSYCDYRQNVDCDVTTTTSTTTVSPPPPSNNGTCPDDLKDGDDCNPMVDCNQCGHCDWYFVCVASGDTTGNWRRKECDVKGDPATAIIRVDDKMFFHRGVTSYGGMCAPGIPTDLVDEYTSDPTCKFPCLFESVDDCSRAYVYKDPDFTKGIWSDPGSRLLCPEGTKWNQTVLTCVFCADGETCDCN